MPETAGWKFSLSSKPFVLLRVTAYIIIIACLWFWRTQNRRAAGPEHPAGSTGTKVNAGTDGTLTTETTLYYPTVTLYGWRVKPLDDGSQQVDVLLKFGANSEEIEFREMRLRAKGHSEDLALAEETGGVTKVKPGIGKVTFRIPPGKDEFRAGQVYLWVKDLCILNSNQRLAPADFDKWEEEMKQAEEKAEPGTTDRGTPEAPASSTPPPRVPEDAAPPARP